ncbi:ketopantoate hydroxymethyltransferase-domain-containing protein [Entophlyctis helioformis]|nr:ketopantoate hydroxymethyltransferase-domain-containing protein [Entophlyctis helioformis]
MQPVQRFLRTCVASRTPAAAASTASAASAARATACAVHSGIPAMAATAATAASMRHGSGTMQTRSFSSPPPEPKTAANQSRKKVTIPTLHKLYKEGTPITVMTAHDYPTGMFVEKAGIDICLVGDSLAMVALGYESTNKITLEEMMHHSKAVARGSTCAFLVGDMPFGTFEVSPEHALRNAIRFIHEGNVEAVKLEGGVEISATVKRITDVGIPVMGHIGLTPQRQTSLGGFKVQGKTLEKAQGLLEDALALQEAGCFSIVLEAMPQAVARFLTSQLKVPTIGIGAGPDTSGQVLVMMDALGVYDKLSPKFSNVYAAVGEQAIGGLREFSDAVRARAFPVPGKHTYKMADGEEERFKEWVAAYESKKSASL